jgi:hypothetical protein
MKLGEMGSCKTEGIMPTGMYGTCSCCSLSYTLALRALCQPGLYGTCSCCSFKLHFTGKPDAHVQARRKALCLQRHTGLVAFVTQATFCGNYESQGHTGHVAVVA